jgi:hypothetical protein
MCVTFDKIKEGVCPNAQKATDSVEMDSNIHTGWFREYESFYEF